MSIFKRREIPMALYIGAMVFLLFAYYTDIGTNYAADVRQWGIQISTFAVLVGVFMLFKFHITKIMRRQTDWIYSIVIFAFFFFYLGVQYASADLYQYVLINIYTPISYASAYGVASTTILYRGARTRSIYALLILISFVITSMFNSAIGPMIWQGFIPWGAWLKNVPNTGAMRAITIGMGIGLLAVVIRVLLGMERSYLGEISR
jgi:hypothetical protein